MAPAGAEGAGSNGGSNSHTLRQLCRRRLLEGMVKQVLESGAIAGNQTAAQRIQNAGTSSSSIASAASTTDKPDKRKHPYIVLVADAVTVPIVQSACEMHDLLHEGICLIERIDNPRQPLPMLDAIYFISPTSANASRLVRDAEDVDPEGKQRGPMYKTFNVFFSHRLADDLLAQVARSRVAASRMTSFSELNLSFATYDERSFHFSNKESRKLRKLLMRERPTPEELSDQANRLATVLVSLGTTSKIAYHSPAQGKPQESGAPELAKKVQERVSEIEAKGYSIKSGASLNCTCVIVDRTIDWISPLAYDMGYESILYDALGPDNGELEENKYTYADSSDNTAKTVSLSADKDKYYSQFRHLPLWQVNAVVAEGIQDWQQKDNAMRERTANSGAASMGQMVSSTLSALQALPEHKDVFKKLTSHSEICQRCVKLVEAEELVDVTSLMNDLACGTDAESQRLSERKVDGDLQKLLSNQHLSPECRLRLLLLYSCSEFGIAAVGASKVDTFADLLEPQDAELMKHAVWKSARSSMKEELIAKRRRRLAEKVQSSTPRSRNLCRWEPRLYDIVEDALRGQLDASEFKTMPERKSAVGRTPTAQRQAVVVFIVGGVSLPEVRSAHEISAKLGVEVFVGGSFMLTPTIVLGALRDAVNPPPDDNEDEDQGDDVPLEED
eukprot:TRINITY_DN64507_c0_g1_i1.p1 TRINITY_DN64507_c0_g1~~TRINITY_DN64507_c0_g1_i1.p1  ORF type:complete len:673 (+),score=157.01 TRINITY_DN64507_c0_g1_i1:76-2094(+)